MTEKPISFSAPMVRAIIDGRKTQTRRVITVPWAKKRKTTPYSPYFEESDGKLLFQDEFGDWLDFEKKWQCPYGSKGTKLWIREEWRTIKDQDHLKPSNCCIASTIQYRSDMSTQIPGDTTKDEDFGKWRRSRFIPKSFSRLQQLLVKDVRVERVQDITEEDAKAEGVESLDSERTIEEADYSICERCGGTGLYNDVGPSLGVIPDCDCPDCDTHLKRFQNLWDIINSRRPGCSWKDSPWVWVVEFERIPND